MSVNELFQHTDYIVKFNPVYVQCKYPVPVLYCIDVLCDMEGGEGRGRDITCLHEFWFSICCDFEYAVWGCHSVF